MARHNGVPGNRINNGHRQSGEKKSNPDTQWRAKMELKKRFRILKAREVFMNSLISFKLQFRGQLVFIMVILDWI